MKQTMMMLKWVQALEKQRAVEIEPSILVAVEFEVLLTETAEIAMAEQEATDRVAQELEQRFIAMDMMAQRNWFQPKMM